MIRTQDQAQNEKRLTFKSKRLQPKSVWLTAALFDIRPRDRVSVGRSVSRSQINKSAHAIMWLYTSCKPRKNYELKSIFYHFTKTTFHVPLEVTNNDVFCHIFAILDLQSTFL